MSRERTTWNRAEIKRTAAMPKQADPYLMNQDHVSQNPRADKYMNGTPSSWAEDVHSPNEWEKEYAGGATKRDETGHAEFRPETFNHPEKTASQDLIVKKADLCVKVARLMMPKSAEAMVEDQAVALMSLPDSDLIDTYQRLAAQDQGQGQGQEQAPAQQQQQQAATQPVAQEQVQEQAPAQEQAPQQQQATQQQQAGMDQQAVQQMVQQAVDQCMATMKQQQGAQADFPGGDWGKNNPVASKKAQDQGGQGQSQEQQAPAQQQTQQATQQQTQQAGMDQQAVQQMVQQAVQQMMQQMQGQQQVQVEEQGGQDDQLLDDMLAPQTASAEAPVASVGDIELEASPMDVGEVTLTAEDDVLKTLFATQESQDAEQAQQAQGGQQQAQASVRSPATRTVGTRPTAGVSRVGGSGAPGVKTAAQETDKLASLWASAPDVREHFGLK